MMPQTSIKTLALAVSLCTLSATPFYSTASDWKSYPGAFCQGPNSSTDLRRSGNGSLSNWQRSPVTVHCPVLRDVQAGGSNRVKLVRISLFNNHRSVGGYCRLVSLNSSGSIIAWDQYNWRGGFRNVTASLGPLNAQSWGSYHIYCRLPGTDGARKTFIRNVRVDENT